MTTFVGIKLTGGIGFDTFTQPIDCPRAKLPAPSLASNPTQY